MNKSSELLQQKTIKTNRTPMVTIGICVRNSEATIKEAIDSVLIQDFPHELIEIIFVDDGSTDKTLSIIEGYVPKMDMHVKVFHHGWKGLGASRNVVVNNARGNYIVWVDGDMLLSRDFVGRLVDYMQAHPKVGVTKGKQALETGANLLSTLENFSRAASRMQNYDKESRGKALGTGGSIYRVEDIRQAGMFDENLRGYGEDLDLEIRVRRIGLTLCTVNAKFLDYERNRLTWETLWSRYWWRGYFTHYFLHKNKGLLKHYKMFPPAAFLAGFFHARKLFALTRKKMVFLLPFQYIFKMTAWYVGFVRSHIDSYEPKN